GRRPLTTPLARPTPDAAAVRVVTIGGAAMGRAPAVAASPATSGATGRWTTPTKRSRRRTKFRAPTNPPPNAAAPISKPIIWSLPVARPTQLATGEFPPQSLPVQPSRSFVNQRSDDAPYLVCDARVAWPRVRRRLPVRPDPARPLHDVHAPQRPAGAGARGPLGAGGGGEHVVPRRVVGRADRSHRVRPSVRAHHVHGLGARSDGRVRPAPRGGGRRQQ